MTTLHSSGTWDLSEIAREDVLPVEHTDGCAVHSPVFDQRRGRMFLAAPQTSSENAQGHRYDSLLAFQLPGFKNAEVIGRDWKLEDPLALAFDGGSQLLASESTTDHPFGVGSGYGSITWVDVSKPGRAQKIIRRDGVSFTPTAVAEGTSIWDEARLIKFPNGQPVEETLDLNKLLTSRRGEPLWPYATPISPGDHRLSVLDNFLAAFANRALFALRDAPTITLVVGTIVPPSVQVLKPKVGHEAAVFLSADGKRIVVLERHNNEYTGRLVTLDAERGTVLADWFVGELSLPPNYYLCTRGPLLFFGRGHNLVIIKEGSSKPINVPVTREIDTYAHCLFADR